MLRSVNWGEKVGQLFGGHLGRVLKVTAIFACAVVLLLGLYRVRTTRINNEETTKNQLLKSVGLSGVSSIADRWLIVGNPDDDSLSPSRLDEPSSGGSTEYNSGSHIIPGSEYVCAAAGVAGAAGWKTIVIGPPLDCCSKPHCHSMEKSQFLRLPYRSASVIRHLLGHGAEREPYKETIRNLGFLWAIHRGARFIFDAYVEEYQSAGIPLAQFEEETSRQLQSLALDESLSLVEERSKTRSSALKANPYTHFGRADVKLLPGGASPTIFQTHAHLPSSDKDFPSFRICEVRPPSIEKFLEIDEGWWDTRAPPLVLPGDTMPPLCTRNTLFSPEVFWALPILPDYSTLDADGVNVNMSLSRIPPWYIRGLWSQSLLGDLGGSIRLSLSRIPTLQITGPDYSLGGESRLMRNYAESNVNRTRGSRLLKRWNCRSKSTFRCLLLMAKELRKSVYFGKDDISLIEAWIVDLKSIHYSEPRMLPKRRSQTAPCLGADGLHGVTFHPALEPKEAFMSAEFVAERQKIINGVLSTSQFGSTQNGGFEGDSEGGREKRETERPTELSQALLPPSETAAGYTSDWSIHSSDYGNHGEHASSTAVASQTEDSYLPRATADDSYEIVEGERGIPFPRLDKPISAFLGPSPSAARTGKQFRAFLQQVVAKSLHEGATGDAFPILKAMADNICPGFGPLLPFQPQKVESDILLIIAFTNHHYDLIPTLEVIYRSTYPNILYCGHPHESVEIFLRKYQTVEHRSFSFLPTYTRATYECLLGAIEMNYDVKGFLLITDETLLAPSQLKGLDKEKLWVSSTGVDKVSRNNWQRIDPGGQKLPKLIDGITSAWKLFSYILQGQDSTPFLQPETKRMHRRRRDSESGESGETLDQGETAYIHQPPFTWDHGPSAPTTELPRPAKDGKAAKGEDLAVSDWDYLNPVKQVSKNEGDASGRNENGTTGNEDMDEVLIGEEEDDGSNMTEVLSGLKQMAAELSSSSSRPIDLSQTDDIQAEFGEQLLSPQDQNLTDEILVLDQSTYPSSTPIPSSGLEETSATEDTEDTSLGVPLYHVEHVDQPKVLPKWQPPTTSTESGGTGTISTQSSSTVTPTLKPNEEEKEDGSTTPRPLLIQPQEELHLEMEALLEGVHQTYAALLEVVSDYEENNKDSSSYPPKLIHPTDFSSELTEASLLEDVKSHRISPREFRHIRCTRVDDGHQSELCGTLRNYVRTLGGNIGRDVRLFHASTPLYYVPTQGTRSLYSIANVLLHYGVMDELALPLLFRGLANEEDWINFNATTLLTDPKNNDPKSPEFLFPFNLHKVYADKSLQEEFCFKFLLPILTQ